MTMRQVGSDDKLHIGLTDPLSEDASYTAAIPLSPQGEFLQGEIMAAYLPATGIDGLNVPLMRAWTTAVCRVLSRLFSCDDPRPSRSPFCDDKKT